MDVNIDAQTHKAVCVCVESCADFALRKSALLAKCRNEYHEKYSEL